MVSPLGGIPQLRTTHFLKPITSFIEGPSLKLPSLPFSYEFEWPLKKEKVCDVLPGLPIEFQLKQVENHPNVPPGFPPKCCAENDKKNLSIGVSKTMACDIVTLGFVVKHITEESVYTSTDYAHDRNESSSVVSPKCNGENDKENLYVAVGQTMACNIVAPGLTDKYNVGESVHTSIGVHESNKSSSAVPPNCNGENDKENLSMEVCQTVACDVLPPGSMEKHTVGERVI
ncbi:hypothetical protein HAX54_009088 [Datura stramonium]|uniref:Uncharacterized protein n=1 Tax=Datura stramonium TaxID=4076 RepID=A0ABS8RVU4_DATST|nr:hypothetical protein [Datura stramonium]